VVVETPINLTAEQRQLLRAFEATFEGEEGARHSPRSSSFLDGVKAFWDRMTS
jgi:molecular chaperone DnaJ